MLLNPNLVGRVSPRALNMPPSDEEWVEAGLTADESLGHPATRPAAEGIKEMTARCDLLLERIKQREIRDQKVGPPSEELRTLYTELREAKERLAEYTRLHEGRN